MLTTSSILALFLAGLCQKYGNSTYIHSFLPIDFADPRSVPTASAENTSRQIINVKRDVVYKESDLSMTLQPVKFGFAAPVKISNQNFELLVDTGSSDTWVVDSFFTCLNNSSPSYSIGVYKQSKCLFGSLYDRGLDNSFRSISGYSFQVKYASGDAAGGPMGYAQIELAENLTIPAQQIGLASATVWGGGDGITSGILGLGLPGLTHRYQSTNIWWEDIPCNPGFVYSCNQGYYQPVVWSLFNDFTTADNIKNEALLSEQVFSLALARNSSASRGLLTFGGVPDLSLSLVNVTTPFIQVPLEIKKYDNDYRHYVISTPSFTYGVTNNLTTASTNIQYIVDAGAIWNFLPANISKGINLSFSPPAFRYTADSEPAFNPPPWAVNCEHVAPEVGIKLGGEMFWHNEDDLVRRFQVIETDNNGNKVQKEICLSTIQDGVPGAFEKPNSNYLLGQPFLNNVLAVFDIGRLEMGFAARTEYA